MDHKSVLNGCDSAEVLQKEPQNRRQGRENNDATPFTKKNTHAQTHPRLNFELAKWREMAAGFEGLSAEEICTYMKEQIPSISDELLERFEEHKIDGSVFLELNDEYLHEIAPRLGDRLKLKIIIAKANPVSWIILF